MFYNLLRERDGSTFSVVLDLLGLSFPYVFSLTDSLTGLLELGLLVVA